MDSSHEIAPPAPPADEINPWARAMAGYYRRVLPATIQGISVDALLKGEDSDSLSKPLVELWSTSGAWDAYERALGMRLHAECTPGVEKLRSTADMERHATNEVCHGLGESLRQMKNEPIIRPIRVAFLLPIRPPMLFVGWRDGEGRRMLVYDTRVLGVWAAWGKKIKREEHTSTAEAIALVLVGRHAADGAINQLIDLLIDQPEEGFVLSRGYLMEKLGVGETPPPPTIIAPDSRIVVPGREGPLQ